jgi:DNA mismatch repair ATPase MutL
MTMNENTESTNTAATQMTQTQTQSDQQPVQSQQSQQSGRSQQPAQSPSSEESQSQAPTSQAPTNGGSSYQPAFAAARVNLRQDERKATETFERADAIAEAVANSGIADKIDVLSREISIVNWILLGEVLILITLAMAAIAAPPTLIVLIAFLVVMGITFGFRQHFVHQRKVQENKLAQLRQKVRIEHTPSMRRNSHGGYLA